MPRILNTHVSFWGESAELVMLAPGQELPDWAEGKVGEHCLVPADSDAETDDAAGDDVAEGGEDKDGEDTPPADDEQPDFTAPARRGRARKP